MTKMQLQKEFNASQGEASRNVAATADANVAADLRATAAAAAATGNSNYNGHRMLLPLKVYAITQRLLRFHAQLKCNKSLH